MVHRIGNGVNTMLWFDNWLPMGPIISNFGERIINDSGQPGYATVSSIIQNDDWALPVANFLDLITLKEAIRASPNPRSSQTDKLQWSPSPSGCFSTSFAWKALRRARPAVFWHNLVWFPSLIPKVSFKLWLVVRQRLGTQDRLFAPITTGCLLCGHKLENHDHPFLIVLSPNKFGLPCSQNVAINFKA